ncbi:MAG TPA: protein kinase [Herpetosiphonaceae bacterium]
MSNLELNTLIYDRYRIVRLIGQGGFGAVYEALDIRLNRRVAIKRLLRVGERLSKQFEREAQLLANLIHPALPRVTDHFTDTAGQFLVMDYIAGPDLAAQLYERDAPFPLDQVLQWTEQLLEVLVYLHDHDPPIVHRDIKPTNLKLTARGNIMLLDFGLAKGFAGQQKPSTLESSILAYTKGFAPPEQVEGRGTEPRSDLYGLAATIYCLLTNQVPPEAVLRLLADARQRPDPLALAHEVNPAIPVEVSAVLHHALALEPSDRPATAKAMQDALLAAVASTGTSAQAQRNPEAAAHTTPTIIDTPEQALPAPAIDADKDAALPPIVVLPSSQATASELTHQGEHTQLGPTPEVVNTTGQDRSAAASTEVVPLLTLTPEAAIDAERMRATVTEAPEPSDHLLNTSATPISSQPQRKKGRSRLTIALGSLGIAAVLGGSMLFMPDAFGIVGPIAPIATSTATPTSAPTILATRTSVPLKPSPEPPTPTPTTAPPKRTGVTLKPTSAPSTPTPEPPTATPEPPTPEPPTATSVPPTSIPPTRVPPTRIPPTRVPPTRVPPTVVPQPKLPDFTGMDIQRARTILQNFGAEVKVEQVSGSPGNLTVFQQSPAPGTPIRRGMVVWLYVSVP